MTIKLSKLIIYNPMFRIRKVHKLLQIVFTEFVVPFAYTEHWMWLLFSIRSTPNLQIFTRSKVRRVSKISDSYRVHASSRHQLFLLFSICPAQTTDLIIIRASPNIVTDRPPRFAPPVLSRQTLCAPLNEIDAIGRRI